MAGPRVDPPTGCRYCGGAPEAACCDMYLCAVCGLAHWAEDHGREEADDVADA